MSDRYNSLSKTEWPTVALLFACYAVWALGTTILWQLFWPMGILFTTLSITLYSSLQHEVLHGHPFRSGWLSEALVLPGLTIAIPYLRFRDLHLAHHTDQKLTDPYDDPESNFLDPEIWHKLSGTAKVILKFNNTLAGRLLVGPLVSQVSFMRADWQAIKSGDRPVLMGWVWHLPAVALVGLWFAIFADMPIGSYLVCAYMGLSILKIRTFLEHRAHDRASGRTVVVDSRGLLSFLFLNNNLHVVHHMHPRIAWYVLPKLFSDNREHYLRRNDSYYYRSYTQIFRAHFWRAKDPVPHPLWHHD
ncbi:MAG: fatty acid desaturase [Paracoccaceae bacterium]